MDYKTNMLIRIIIGVGIPAALIVLFIFHILNFKFAFGIIGWIGAIYAFYYLNRRPDERIKRLDKYAHTWAWFSTYCFMLGWWYIDHFNIVKLKSEHLISLFLFFSVYSKLVINFIVSARSDVPE